MQISSTWMRVDNYVDHAQKIVYLLLDLSLNLYFLYLVRTKLVAAGLQKYKKLFWFNAAIVWVSMSMDVRIHLTSYRRLLILAAVGDDHRPDES